MVGRVGSSPRASQARGVRRHERKTERACKLGCHSIRPSLALHGPRLHGLTTRATPAFGHVAQRAEHWLCKPGDDFDSCRGNSARVGQPGSPSLAHTEASRPSSSRRVVVRAETAGQSAVTRTKSSVRCALRHRWSQTAGLRARLQQRRLGVPIRPKAQAAVFVDSRDVRAARCEAQALARD
jgi:hypothetical protein